MNKQENGIIEDVSEDTDEILEDTTSIDRKTSWLIILWIIDKIIMALLILLLGKQEVKYDK